MNTTRRTPHGRAEIILTNLAAQGWRLKAATHDGQVWSAIEAVELTREPKADLFSLEAFRKLPGGQITIEVEGANPIALVDDVLKLCQSVVVTE